MDAASESKCPVKHGSQSSWLGFGSAPTENPTEAAPPSGAANSKSDISPEIEQLASGCPLQKGCDSSQLDSRDMVAKQLAFDTVGDVFPDAIPLPGQKKPLSAQSVQSNIPKGGSDDESTTWTFPSPQVLSHSRYPLETSSRDYRSQSSNHYLNESITRSFAVCLLSRSFRYLQANALHRHVQALLVAFVRLLPLTSRLWFLQRFYNAMKKKGWEPQEEEIPTVVNIHNAVNERCWREVDIEHFAFEFC